jgi:hypothetical protein
MYNISKEKSVSFRLISQYNTVQQSNVILESVRIKTRNMKNTNHYKLMVMLMLMQMCSVPCQANTGFQAQILLTECLSVISNHPAYHPNTTKFGILS